MAPLEFKELSLDIKKLLVSYVTRPTDLKSLCLTCKELRELTTPSLYHTITLLVGGHQDVRLSAFLGRDNPGIPHIREIYLHLERISTARKSRQYESDDSSNEEEIEEDIAIPARQAQFTVRLLLDFLPSHILEVFNWQSWQPLSTDNFLLLIKKHHRSLRALDVGPMTRELAPSLEKQPELFTNLPQLKRLYLNPDTVDRLKACQKFLQAQPQIENLCIFSAFEHSNEDPEDLHDSSTRPGLLSRTIFSHKLPFDGCDPMVLKTLDLNSIDVRYAADTWLRVMKFSSLEQLEICDCAGADALFAQLSKPHIRPNRLRTLRWMDDCSAEPHGLEAFEGFLEGLSSLVTLHVYVNNLMALPKVTAITRHSNTLRSLSIHTQESSTTPHCYSDADFSKICTDCSEIRELSVMFPKTNIEAYSPSDEFEAFLTSTRKLQYLTTLNIRRWPTTKESFVSSYNRFLPAALALYEFHLQRVTQGIFKASDAHAKDNSYGLGTRSKLSVLVWGGNGRTRYEDNVYFKLKQIPFVRGLKVDPFGQSSMLAVQTVWRLVSYVEPESDILNHSLYDLSNGSL